MLAEWAKYQLYGVPEGPVGDMMRRDLLLTRIHAILREELRERIAKDPAMTSASVYEPLKNIFLWLTPISGE